MSLSEETQKPTKIKICGISNVNQAVAIAELGPDAIGVIGVKNSPRFVNERLRREIFTELERVNPALKRVWVIADLIDSELDKGLCGKGLPSVIQLHGNESQKRCKELRKKYPEFLWWKAIRLRKKSDVGVLNSYVNSIDALLLDAWDKSQLGGTGKRVPIDWLSEKTIECPWWIAGGISLDILNETITQLKPFGIDASSKLEISPGIKDIKKVSLFIDKIRYLQSNRP